MTQRLLSSLLVLATTLAAFVFGQAGLAEDTRPVSRTTQESWAPKVFGFCMQVSDAKKRSLLRENAAKIFIVTINGAKLGTKSWTNGLILPLDQGDFDNRQLLATLRDAGYRGPMG